MPRFGCTDQRLRDDSVDLLGNSHITPVQLEDVHCADFYYSMQIAPWWFVAVDPQIIDTKLVSNKTPGKRS